ncbi:hypothetical protein DSO57_1018290 [Entomophthora muscae]|uniref:Uncharacterized protein n=1 Tax=Entomophthora muscae TaxID=34485 RepID=A0ACC2UED2_9FUNG|nr:hypothetical protein DSO57_1018290 [Entomophthora muscae]
MTSDKSNITDGPLSLGAHIKNGSISRLINEITAKTHELQQPAKATSKRTLNLTKELYALTKAQELPYRLVSRNIVRSKATWFWLR